MAAPHLPRSIGEIVTRTALPASLFSDRHPPVRTSSSRPAGCRDHATADVVAECSTCGDPYCDRCLVDTPFHGTTCVACALEHAGVRSAARTRRRRQPRLRVAA